MEILRFFVLLSLIVDIASAVYKHNFSAALGYFLALSWFGLYWYTDKKKKRPVINIFIEKEDGNKESEDDAQGSQAD